MDATHILAIVYSCLILAGCCTNLLIIIGTCRSKSLHGCCNVLIAFCAFFDIMHVLGQTPKTVPVFFGTNEILSLTCSFIQIIPNFGVNGGVVIVLLIAVDRFIAVYAPQFYLVKDSRRYLLCYCLVIIAYAAFQYAVAYHYFENKYVVCSPPDLYLGNGEDIWGIISLSLIALSLVIYYAVWLKLKHTAVFNPDRRTFRSILAVMCVIILGWLLSMSMCNFVRHGLHLQGREAGIGISISGIPVNAAVSFNCLVLYFTAAEYRRAFRRQLRLLPGVGRWFHKEEILQLSTTQETSKTTGKY